MLLPPGQRLPLGNLLNLLNKRHGCVRIELVFQHLPDKPLGPFRECPRIHAARVPARTGIRDIEDITNPHAARSGGQKGDAFGPTPDIAAHGVVP